MLEVGNLCIALFRSRPLGTRRGLSGPKSIPAIALSVVNGENRSMLEVAESRRQQLPRWLGTSRFMRLPRRTSTRLDTCFLSGFKASRHLPRLSRLSLRSVACKEYSPAMLGNLDEQAYMRNFHEKF